METRLIFKDLSKRFYNNVDKLELIIIKLDYFYLIL